MRPKWIHRFIGTSAAALIPILFMALSHILWMSDNRAKMRMAMKQGGFWGGMIGTMYVSHRIAPRAATVGRSALYYALASTFPILGYEIMSALAKRLFPKQKASPPVETSFMPSPPPRISEAASPAPISLPPVEAPVAPPSRLYSGYSPAYGTPQYGTLQGYYPASPASYYSAWSRPWG